ncbi:MAG: hypothetical protein GF332_02065, partial [Candidatus Moranbacteria bacterium]|nr:hypothetical protein [Candidatus Moranbacteria bacterium]
MKNKLIASMIALISFVSLIGVANATNGQSMQLVATVNIQKAEITNQTSNDFQIDFTITNQINVQPDIKYAVSLHELNTQKQIHLKTYSEVLNLGQNSSETRSIVYEAPKFLKGDYELQLTARNSKGLLLASHSLGQVNLFGSGEYLMLDLNQCELSSGLNQPSPAQQGLTLNPANQKTLTLNCPVQNLSSQQIKFNFLANIYLRTALGEMIASEKSKQPYTIEPNQTTDFNFPIDIQTQPSNYQVEFFLEKSGSQISNTIIFPYKVQGLNPSIENLRLDKSDYQKGETITINYSWVAGSTDLQKDELFLDLKIKDNLNRDCLEQQKISLDPNNPYQVFEAEAEKNCKNPTVTANIVDKAGKVLDSNQHDLSSVKDYPAQIQKTNLALRIIVIILTLGLFLGLGYLYVTKKNNQKTVKLLFFSFIASLFFLSIAKQTKADTYSATIPHRNINFTININYQNLSTDNQNPTEVNVGDEITYTLSPIESSETDKTTLMQKNLDHAIAHVSIHKNGFGDGGDRILPDLINVLTADYSRRDEDNSTKTNNYKVQTSDCEKNVSSLNYHGTLRLHLQGVDANNNQNQTDFKEFTFNIVPQAQAATDVEEVRFQEQRYFKAICQGPGSGPGPTNIEDPQNPPQCKTFNQTFADSNELYNHIGRDWQKLCENTTIVGGSVGENNDRTKIIWRCDSVNEQCSADKTQSPPTQTAIPTQSQGEMACVQTFGGEPFTDWQDFIARGINGSDWSLLCENSSVVSGSFNDP